MFITRRVGAPTLLATLALGALLSPLSARADVTLPPLIADNMVLERDTAVRIYGRADAGEKVSVSIQGKKADTTTGADGNWQVMLPALKSGGPFTLTVTGNNTLTLNNVLVGEVWVCSGQSNMEWALRNAAEGTGAIAASANPNIHLFHVAKVKANTPQETVKVQAPWQECGPQTVPGFSAVGYFFARDLQKALGVPIGLIESDWGGSPAEAWTRETVLSANPYTKKTYLDVYPASYARFQQAQADFAAQVEKAKAANQPAPRAPGAPWRPAELYNGMIAPLVKYTIKGALWYQGESNSGNGMGYRTLLPTMIQNWRDDWGIKDFPFLVVELAPFGNGNSSATSYAETREAQLYATQVLPNVGLAVITDVGEERDIHPKRKEPVGQRLALLARKIGYGEDIVAMGPTLKSVSYKGDTAVVRFNNVGDGLTTRGGDSSGATVSADTLTGFTVAGVDGKFVPATAKITGKDTVEVSAPGVTSPVAVRYGFVNFPVVNLWNINGLPANPFRSDAPKGNP